MTEAHAAAALPALSEEVPSEDPFLRDFPPGKFEELRVDFSEEAMNKGASNAIQGNQDGQPFLDFIMSRFFEEGDDRFRDRQGRYLIPNDRREQCIITYLTTKATAAPLYLALHAYWGMMVGLEPRVVADTMLLTGLYGGFPEYNSALGVLRQVIATLKVFVTTHSAPYDTNEVVGALMAAFTPVMKA
jgi:hypothetical protein